MPAPPPTPEFRSRADGRGVFLRFDGESMAVRAVLGAVRGALARRCAPGVLDRLEIVLGEVLNNIAEHGYDPAIPGEVELDLLAKDHVIGVKVADRGRPLPGLALPEGALPEIGETISDLPEGGFGWHLIRSLSNGIRYERAGGRNVLRFSIAADP